VAERRVSFLDPNKRADPLVCCVCGHRTVPIVRRSVNGIVLVLLGALLCYIALDIADNGRLDSSLFVLIRTHGAPPASPR
jgi:hypothetical protein